MLNNRLKRNLRNRLLFFRLLLRELGRFWFPRRQSRRRRIWFQQQHRAIRVITPELLIFRIAQIARDYLARHRQGHLRCRFDVVSIQFDTGRPVVELFQNAFDA